MSQEVELNIRVWGAMGVLVAWLVIVGIVGHYKKGWRTYDYMPQLWAIEIPVILSWALISFIYALPVPLLWAILGIVVTLLMFFVIALGREGIRQSADILEKGFKFTLTFSLAVGVWILAFGTLGMPSYKDTLLPNDPFTASDGLITSFGYAGVMVLALAAVKILRKK